jgi:uncharacterized membrane protein HdeD (DUF308 family)
MRTAQVSENRSALEAYRWIGSQPGARIMPGRTNNTVDQALFPDVLTAEPPLSPIWLVIFGTILVALGAIAVFSIVTATIISVYFVAGSMVAAGSAEIVLGWRSRSSAKRTTWMLLGVLYVVAGVFAFLNPFLAAGALTFLMGASLIGAGITRLILSFQLRSGIRWWWVALSAVVTTLLGIMILMQWPVSSLYMLGIFLSIDLIFTGLCWIMIGATAASVRDAVSLGP